MVNKRFPFLDGHKQKAVIIPNLQPFEDFGVLSNLLL